MPKYEAPRNDGTRLGTLKRIITTAVQDHLQGYVLISLVLLQAIKEFVPGFELCWNVINARLSKRSKEVREKAVAVTLLDMYIRDLWEVLKRRVRRLNLPAEVHTFYQLPLSGIIPKVMTQEELFSIAEKIISGDANAVKAGYEPMLNPTASEIEVVLRNAVSESDDVAIADREYDDAQNELAKLRPRADELIEEAMAELRFSLRKKDAPSQRRVMRTYGARFSYVKGEPLDEGDTGEDEIDIVEDEETNEDSDQ